jgi:two-component system, LytTR family, response regulator
MSILTSDAIHVAIVDDEERCSNSLVQLLNMHCPYVMIDAVCDSVHRALEILPGIHPDALFLDVMLGDGSGFDILQRLPEMKSSVIFTTAHSEYALKAIKYSAMDYLLKPIDSDELVAAIAKVGRSRELNEAIEARLRLLYLHLEGGAREEKIALPTSDGYCFIEIASIISCEAQSNYTVFKLNKGEKRIVSKTMKEYELLLEERGFFRIHRSYMINLKHVKSYYRGKGGYVVMSDGSELEVSPRCRDDLLQRLNI